MVFYPAGPLIGVWPPPVRKSFCKREQGNEKDHLAHTIASYLSLASEIDIDAQWLIEAFETRYPDKQFTLARLSTFIVEHGVLSVGDRHTLQQVHASDWPKAFKRKADRAGFLRDGQDVFQWLDRGHPVLHIKPDGKMQVLTLYTKIDLEEGLAMGRFFMVLFPNVLEPVRSIPSPNKQATSFNLRLIFQVVFLILCFLVTLFFFSLLLHLARLEHLTLRTSQTQIFNSFSSYEDNHSISCSVRSTGRP
jgi:hypothetical protein